MNKSIIVADDHPITARGMESYLLTLGFHVIGNYQNGEIAYNQIISKNPDFALLDINMPGLCGLEVLEEIKKKNVKTKTIIYTMHHDLALFSRAKELGVNGFLLKEFALEDFKNCINSIEKGQNWYHPKMEKLLSTSEVSFDAKLYCKLNSRERAIIKAIAENKSTKEISDELFLAEKTIEGLRGNIRKKLNLSNKRNALMVWSIRNYNFFKLME